jgi:hypothetical protein
MVWTYVEVGVGVVAACLPTLKPIFDGRSLDSIVASVRSVLSIASIHSNNSRRSRANATNDLEMFPYDVSKQDHNYSQISGAESTAEQPSVPAKAILRQDNVTVQSERAPDVAASTSHESTSRRDYP